MSYNNIDPIVNELYIGSDGVRYAKEMTNEQHTVNNNKIVLNGLPDNGYRISVEYSGALMVEIPIRELIEDERNFKVDYNYGYIYFHPNLEGKNIVVKEYHSRGLSYFPASRIYVEVDEWGKVRETLADSATMINKVSAITDSLPSMLQDMLEREQSLIDASARAKEQEDIIANFQADFERVETIAQEATRQAGAREVRLIHEPMAAAIGIGIDILEPTGNIIVDIGGGTSEIAVIALGGIVNNTSIRTAGDDLNADIIDYMRLQHKISIGDRMAERIKIEVGAAVTDLDDPPEDFEVLGRDMITGTPKSIKVNYMEIAETLDKSISKIETAVLNALEKTPPELSADIYRTGIYLAGGGSLLRGLDKRISRATKLAVHVAEDPLKAVARGTGIALKNFEKFTFLIK